MNTLLAAIAANLQFAPASMDRVDRAVLVFESNNERIARAGLVLGDMEDQPGSFDPWCRGFAHLADSK
jgi:hypothetical protein